MKKAFVKEQGEIDKVLGLCLVRIGQIEQAQYEAKMGAQLKPIFELRLFEKGLQGVPIDRVKELASGLQNVNFEFTNS